MQQRHVEDVKKNILKQRTIIDHVEFIQVIEEEICIDVVVGMISMIKDVLIVNMKIMKMRLLIIMKRKNYLD